MKAIVLVAALVLPALAGAALAGAPSSPPDDSAAAFDFSQFAPGAPVFYVFCAQHTTLANCQGMTIYQESNGLGKLQHLGLQISSAKKYDPDAKVLS
ncbi:MAG: hypothetical protein QOE90_2178 [Thermoplasmata archaeon]|jgi:hypothetical protein|nr:hypothetical protein [Thermoplasmata archaeon]